MCYIKYRTIINRANTVVSRTYFAQTRQVLMTSKTDLAVLRECMVYSSTPIHLVEQWEENEETEYEGLPDILFEKEVLPLNYMYQQRLH